MTEPQQRVALVMAASKGIGFASAEALAQGGHDLVICSRSQESLEDARKRLAATGRRIEVVAADVSQPHALEAVFEAADRSFGRLDVLVANAGGPPPGTFMRVADEQWALAFNLTFMSAIRSMRLAVERMLPKQYGRIVIIGSSSVKQPIEGLALSNAFRPALVGAMKTLSQEVVRQGITVNMVSPGRVDTDRVRSLDHSRANAAGVSYEEFRHNYEQSIPAGRYGEPREVGALVGFLGSAAAAYITGQSIIVDGGMLSALP